MAQWVNRLWYNIFVNPLPLPLLCEISGALHLVQPGLTAGSQAGRQSGSQAGRQSDEMQVNFEIFKTNCTPKHSTFRCTVSFKNFEIISIPGIFSSKVYCKVVFKVQKFTKPYDFLPIPTIKYYRT